MPSRPPLGDLRYRLGDLQIQELAEFLEVSPTMLGAVEGGRYPSRSPWKVIDALRRIFEWSLDDSEAVCNGSISPDRFQPLVTGLPESLSSAKRKKLAAIIKARAVV